MKKMLEKHGKIRCVGALLAIISFILFIVGAFVKKDDAVMVLNVIGFLSLLIGGFMYNIESKDHRLVKLLLFFGFAALLFTWIFPYGYFQGLDFYDYGMNRVGLTDIGTALYYGIVYFSLDKILFLLIVAGFYGVLSKVSGYQKLVTGLAKKLKKNPIVTAMVISFIIVALTSLLNQTFVMLAIVPFFVAVLLSMKIDKLTTFAITFGSVLIGVLGATLGTDSLIFFSQYLNVEITTGILYRVIIALVAFFLYNFFICMRLKKVVKDKVKDEDIEDVAFAVESTTKKGSVIPVIVVLGLMLIVIVLGYFNWAALEVTCFDDFHTWLTELTIGEDFTVFAYLLGGSAKALGKFDLIVFMIILVISSILIAFLYRVKVTDYLDAFYNGMKKMVLPILYFVSIYLIFTICYMSPFIPTITNWALNLTEGLNPYITSVVAFITSVFHADFGYSAYAVGGFLSSAYSSNLSVVHTIYAAMYGMAQLIAPTGGILLIGLNLMKVDYKTWFKYIWLFVVSMLVILLVLFTVLTYI